MNKQKILTIRFKNALRQEELQHFRGAINHAMEKANILFHNHTDDNYRYSYPLIQYKRISRCATIVCINEGTGVIGEFFSNCNFDIVLGSKNIELDVDSVKANQVIVQVWDDLFSYRINKWLPFNQTNYRQYSEQEGISEKCTMLEKILIGNILSFAKGLGLFVDKPIICKITDIDKLYVIRYKGVSMTSFDAEFKCNMSILDFVGLGKGVSLGFGTVTRKRINKE